MEVIAMVNKIEGKISAEWIRENKTFFLKFLEETRFPNPLRDGKRGPMFAYPEWLIMFIAILAVKCQEKSYLGIHRMTIQYWDVIAEGLDLKPISERQLRDRLKKICHFPGRPAAFISQIFPGMDKTKSHKR